MFCIVIMGVQDSLNTSLYNTNYIMQAFFLYVVLMGIYHSIYMYYWYAKKWTTLLHRGPVLYS